MKLACVLTVLLFLPTMAFGTTWYVPDDFSKIQDAINASVNGDTIIVRAGTYVENIDFAGKGITVMSESGPDVTVIDGGQPAHPDYASVVLFQNWEGSDSVLEGFTLTNGTGTWYGPWVDYSGGGIFGLGSSPTIRGNIIRGNSAGNGGGVAFREGASPLITDNMIFDNTSTMDGGGVLCWSQGSSATMTGNMIFNNTSTVWHGGGIALGGDCTITISGNEIFGNTAQGDGGGIYGWDGSTTVISDNEIHDNTAASSRGGGVCLVSTDSADLTNNRIYGNTAGRYGGGGLSFWNSVASMVDNVISGNSTVEGGGGIRVDYYSILTSANNIISGNSAAKGGGIDCDNDTSITVTNDTIHGNSASIKGGGIACRQGSSATVTSSILWDNGAVTEGKEIWIGTSTRPSTATIGHSDIEGGQASVYVKSGSTLNWGAGMIDADPLFVDSAGGDFHLTWNSPCKNSGIDSFVTEPADFEGDPRIAYDTVDMGADEFHAHLYRMGDVIPGSKIQLKVVGDPGAAPVRLALGSGIQDPPQTTPYGDLYLVLPPVKTFNLGAIPASGVLVYQASVPGFWLSGDEKPLQALVGPLGNPDSVLTNLLVLKVE